MLLIDRPDGRYIRSSSPLRKMIPFLMTKRNESTVYMDQEVNLTHTLPYIEEANKGHDTKQVTFLQIFLCAVSRILHERPQLNRFVVGRRLFQRNKVEISFAVKKAFRDDGGLTTVKVEFFPDETLQSVHEKIQHAISTGRGDKPTTSESEVNVLTRLPRFLLRTILWGQQFLEYFGLFPGSMIKADPMYASMFIANLGSLGLDAPFHHLYEYGTVSLFGVIGRFRKIPTVSKDGKSLQIHDSVSIKWSFDERITDGYYCAQSLQILKTYLENPSLLEATKNAASTTTE